MNSDETRSFVLIMLSKSREGKENGEEMRMGPIPPPFPNGKGAARVMAVIISHTKVIFVSEGISFSPLGDIVPEA